MWPSTSPVKDAKTGAGAEQEGTVPKAHREDGPTITAPFSVVLESCSVTQDVEVTGREHERPSAHAERRPRISLIRAGVNDEIAEPSALCGTHRPEYPILG